MYILEVWDLYNSLVEQKAGVNRLIYYSLNRYLSYLPPCHTSQNAISSLDTNISSSLNTYFEVTRNNGTLGPVYLFIQVN